MSFITDRDNLFTLVKSMRCREAHLVSNAADYDALFSILLEHIETFNCYNTYLDDVLDLFDPLIRASYSILHDAISVSESNKKIVNNTSISADLDINTGNSNERIYIFASDILNINISNNTTVEYLLISNGCNVQSINIEAGSTIKYLAIKNCGQFSTVVGEIDTENESDQFNINIYKEPNASFGGFKCLPENPL